MWLDANHCLCETGRSHSKLHARLALAASRVPPEADTVYAVGFGCEVAFLLILTMILTASRVSSFHALRSARCAYAGRQFLRTQAPPAGTNSAEAYLEPNHDHPGIVSLLLSRPKAKNSISVRLLKVGYITWRV